jgi:integrase
MTVQLTDKNIAALETREKPYYISDEREKGLSVRVGITGKKTWNYEGPRSRPGMNKRRISLGPVNLTNLKQILARVKEIKAQAILGADAAQCKKDKRSEMTIRRLVDKYEDKGCYWQTARSKFRAFKPQTKRNTINSLNNHVVPLLGTKLISEVTNLDIQEMSIDIGSGRTARGIVTGGEGAARKAVRNLSAVYSWAIYREDVVLNPCALARVNKIDGQMRVFMTEDEIIRFKAALYDMEQDKISMTVINIANLLFYTGFRRNEIYELKWSEVSRDGNSVHLEDTKTGRSWRALGETAQKILAGIKRGKDSDYVFPGKSGDGFFTGMGYYWRMIKKRANLPGISPQVLRHNFGSYMVSIGETLPATGLAMGHSDPKTTARYAEMQEHAAQKAVERLDKKLEGIGFEE